MSLQYDYRDSRQLSLASGFVSRSSLADGDDAVEMGALAQPVEVVFEGSAGKKGKRKGLGDEDQSSLLAGFLSSSSSTTAAVSSRSRCACLSPVAAFWKRRGRCAKISIGLGCSTLFLLLIAVIVLLALGRQIIEARLDATQITFNSLTMTDPSSTGFTLTAEGVLSGLTPISGTVSAMEASLLFDGVVFATTMLPQIHALPFVNNPLTLSNLVTITNQTAFNLFGAALIADETVSFALHGTADVSTPLMSAKGIPFEKTITVSGAGGLPGGVVTSFSLARSTPTQAFVDLTVSLDNPSVAAIEPLGDLAISVEYEGTVMGQVVCTNASLKSGLNALSFSGRLFAPTSPAALAATNEMISRFLSGPSSPGIMMAAVGIGSYPSSLPLYRPLIANLKLTTLLPPSSQPLIQRLVINGMGLRPGVDPGPFAGTTETTVLLDLNATVVINSVLGSNSPLVVKAVALNVTLENDEGAGTAPVPFAQLVAVEQLLPVTAAAPVADADDEGTGDGGFFVSIPLVLTSVPLDITGADGPDGQKIFSPSAFSDFVKAFLQKPQVVMKMAGPGFYSSAIDTASTASNAGPVPPPPPPSITVMPALETAVTCALGNLTLSIPLDLSTTVQGIDGFPNVVVNSFDVTGERYSESNPAVLISINTTIFNPSPATFTLGESLQMGVFYSPDGGSTYYRVGGASAYNSSLVPGFNNLLLTGEISPISSSSSSSSSSAAPSAAVLGAISKLFSDYLNGMFATVHVKGEGVSLAGGVPTPSWLQDAVVSIDMVAAVPGADNLTVFDEAELQELYLAWPANPSPPLQEAPQFAVVVKGNIHLPFAIPVSFPSINLSLVFNEVEDSPVPMASVTLTNQKAVFNPVSSASGQVALREKNGNYPIRGSLTFYLASDANPTTLNLLNQNAFAGFMTKTLVNPSAPLLMTGVSSPTVSLAIGNLSITGVPIYQLTNAPGMNGFTTPPPKVVSVVVTDTTVNSASLAVTMAIVNPSIVKSSLGPVSLALVYNGFTLSTASIDDLSLNPGENLIAAKGFISIPDNATQPAFYAATVEFLSRYLRGIPSTLRLLGGTGFNGNASPYPILVPSFEAFNTSLSFPGLNGPILRNASLYWDVDLLNIPSYLNGTLTLYNPLSVPFLLLNASLQVYVCVNEAPGGKACLPTTNKETGATTSDGYGPPIGSYYAGNLSPIAPYVPAESTVTTGLYKIQLYQDVIADLLILQQLATDGDAITKLNGTITAQIGELLVDLFFEEQAVEMFLFPASKAPPPAGPPPVPVPIVGGAMKRYY